MLNKKIAATTSAYENLFVKSIKICNGILHKADKEKVFEMKYNC